MIDWLAAAPVLFFTFLLVTFALSAARLQRSGTAPVVRPLPALDALRSLAERAIEEGRATHVALGAGTLSGERAVETVVGLAAMHALAEEARRANQIPVVTTSDPAVQLMAGDALARGEPGIADARDYARFVAPQPVAYGAGTRALMQREQLGLTAVLGDIGDEYLFIAAAHPGGGAQFHTPEVAGTTRLETLPLVHLTARDPLLGEELFAYGAYLGRSAQHWAGVVTQDAGRVVIVLLLLGGAIAATVAGLR